MPKAARREQLLDTARKIIAEEGTEALTLGHLAERAGVSKPIAYEHFGTRAGLLVALCDEYNDRQVAAREKALATGSATLADITAIFASAYVNCVLDIGPEMGAAFDALAASEETAAFRQSLRQGYIDEYRKGFGRLVDVPPTEGNAIYAGFLGAAEALANDAAAGRIGRAAAIEALSRIYTSTLERYPRTTD
ncbi:TetR/AcrR family transcriptional regulator [Allomesorhizobium alhagi]|jgi:AcrR family transcriptional regulator|uniref:TetR family transcriptional regulator n=1 Tax=Mesorhizobium alhagi CCNWXJ12-2 TaxID=1107882 RepID=H0HPJ5_9HYPH|nr:TetR/AcrR family transcriptional regulator [Mesorhizobium alhagi]EHK57367.1 TetR family transcriptional regulator [Mesorhizobium alhagi CCNWXJ12-2]